MHKNTSTELSVEWVPTDQLSLNSSNPRINDQAVEHVAASIQRFGWRHLIVARPGGVVIAGNTRLKAARLLGHERVPVVWFEGTGLEATAYAIAGNKTHDFSTWDEPLLAKLILVIGGMTGQQAVELLRARRRGALFNELLARYLLDLPAGPGR